MKKLFQQPITMRVIALCMFFMCAFAGLLQAQGRVYYFTEYGGPCIPNDPEDPNSPPLFRDGSSWNTAMPGQLLATTLENAHSGDVFFVAAGTYKPTASTNDRNATFKIPNGVKVYGGMIQNLNQNLSDPAGLELALLSRNHHLKSILSGDIDNVTDVVTGVGASLAITGNGSNVYNVVTIQGSGGGGTELDGFTITGGYANDGSQGGGMLLQGNASIKNCIFTGNYATNGGAVASSSTGETSFTACTFSQNMSQNSGGALIVEGSTQPSITNCTFYGNRAGVDGGAIMSTIGSTITYCTFYMNHATGGGGINNSATAATITNCLFWGNTASSGGQLNNKGTITYCVIQDWTGGGTGNITTDPFVFPPSFSIVPGAITPTCAIASNGSAYRTGQQIAGVAADQRGKTRNDSPCIGAFEFDGTSVDITVTQTANGTISPAGASGTGLVQVERNSDVTFTFTPSNGCELDSVTVNSNPVQFADLQTADGITYTYTLASVTSTQTIKATFKPIPPRFVTQNGEGVKDGLSWASAYGEAEFRDALQSLNGGPFYVAKGTYKPTSSTTDRTATFTLKKRAKLYGGFEGGEDLTNLAAALAARTPANVSILSGDLLGDDMIGGSGADFTIANNSENSYHVVTCGAGATNADTEINGFTITGGNANVSEGSKNNGGGMLVGSSSPTVANCTFIANTSINHGGGIWTDGASAALINSCTFTKCRALNGGGVHNNNSNAKYRNCTFAYNNTSASGGGMFNEGTCTVEVSNCTFYMNRASASFWSGGMFVRVAGTVTATNCIFWGNYGAVMATQLSPEANPTYCIIQDWTGGGMGNSASAPMLFPLASNGGLTQTCAIAANENGSAYQAGLQIAEVVVDQRGKVRNNPPCIGAFEFDGTSVDITVTQPANGTISPMGDAGVVKVESGSNVTFIITPNFGYELESVTVNSSSVSIATLQKIKYISSVYTFENVTSTQTISATFKPIPPHYVTQSGAGAKDGLSWASAYGEAEFRDALRSLNGGTFYIAKGTYKPTASTTDRDATFALKKGTKFYGGWTGTEDLSTSEKLTAALATRQSANVSILSGDIDGVADAITGSGQTLSITGNGGNLYHVVTGGAGATNADTEINGFTITGGNAGVGAATLNSSGAGMYNSNSSPKIVNCTFEKNVASNWGSGMLNSNGASPEIDNCTFANNLGESGVAMFNVGSSTKPIVTNCTFYGNRGRNGNGGAIHEHEGSKTEYYNCTFANNAITGSMHGNGAAIYGNTDDNTITNCVFWGNTSFLQNVAQLANSNAITYCVIQNWTGSGTGNSTTDPLLFPLASNGGITQTCAIDANGSAYQSGTNTGAPATDQRGKARNSTPCIGAYELQGTPIEITVTQGANGAITHAGASNTLKVESGFSITFIFTPDTGYDLDRITVSGSIINAADITHSPNGTFAYTLCNITANKTITATYKTLTHRYVTQSGADTKDGLSWGTAYGEAEFRDALRSLNGGTFYIAKGTYKPTASTTDRNATFILRKGAKLYGGWAGSEDLSTPEKLTAALATRQPTNVSILSGDIDGVADATTGSGQTLSITGNAGNSYHVVTGGTGAAVDDTEINGFTITGGNAVACSGSDNGGGMLNNNSSPRIANCTFIANQARFGGGLFNQSNSTPNVSNTTFVNNLTSMNGASLFNQTSNATYTNCTFYGNKANNEGGAFKSDDCAPTITNCTFVNNYAQNNAGGMHNWNANPIIKNCIFWGNKMGAGNYDQIVNGNNSSPIVEYCVIQNWTGSGTGNSSTDPLLFPLASNGGITQTCAIDANGSAYQSGTNTGAPATDQRGKARNSTPCIGAFEYQGPPITITVTQPSNGAISPTGVFMVENGSNVTFTFTPDAGYDLNQITVSDSTINVADITCSPNGTCTYTLCNITENKTITATYKTLTPRYVTQSGNGTRDGKTWTNAYGEAEFREALRNLNGGTFYIAKGTYKPEANQEFVLTHNVKLYGGYNPNATGVNEGVSSNRDVVQYPTCLQGSGSRIMTINSTCDNSTEIDGFILKDGIQSSGWDHTHAGAIQNNANVIINNCIFINNKVSSGDFSGCGRGGAIRNDNCSPTISNCTFKDNSVERGVERTGGAIYNEKSSPAIINCTFVENTATYGGAIYNNIFSNATIFNCTFYNNNANTGEAICNASSSNPTITNCILWSNGTDLLYNASGCNPSVSYCVIQGWTEGGTGNITTDPLLSPLASNGGFTQTCAIATTSSAYRTGTHTGAPTTDQRGAVRNNPPCIGAYEYAKLTITASAGANGSITPNGNVDVVFGENKDFVIASDTTSLIESVLVDGVADEVVAGLTSYTHTFVAVSVEHTISATFKLKTYTITATAGENGTITPVGVATVNHGATPAYTASASTGYVIDELEVDSVEVPTAAGLTSYTHIFDAVTTTCTIEVTFKVATYTITATAGDNGTITPVDDATVNHGATPAYTATANVGYLIESLKVNGVAVDTAAGLSTYTHTFAPVTATSTIAVTFKVATYTITASAGAGGSISPAGAATVNHGATPAYTTTANEGYLIESLKVNGVAVPAVAGMDTYTHTFAAVTAPSTIEATFRLKAYTITASAGAGGSISPDGAATVNHGATPAYTTTANEGYLIESLKVNGVAVPAVAGMDTYTHTFAAVTAPSTIEATFRLKAYTITATAGAGGSISPHGDATVNHGATPAYTATANEGYLIESLKVNGVTVVAATGLSTYTHTFAAVTATSTIAVTFKVATYTITASAGDNGTIDPTGVATVNHGSTPAYTATADEGYLIDALKVDGVAVDAAAGLSTFTHTFAPVTAASTIEATFRLKTYTITATAGTGGSISPAGVATVNHGSTPAYTATADEGYLIESLKVNGVAVPAAAGMDTYTHTFAAVAAISTIEATFRLKTYTITATAGENGTITPVGVATVNHGATPAYTATANVGYLIESLKVNGVTVVAATGLSTYTHTFAAVAAISTIEVTFRLKAYTITATAGAGGSISPHGDATVNHGATPAYTATADEGYLIESLKVNGVVVPAAAGLSAYTHTFAAVTAASTIEATFRLKTYTITATAGAGGSISPAGVATVNHGATPAYTATADEGYLIESLKVNGVAVPAATGLSTFTHTFAPVTAASTIEATFRLKAYTITATAGAGGSISPAGVATVNHGATPAYTATANMGYLIESLKVNGVAVPAAAGMDTYTHTFAAVTATSTIEVTFRLKTYTITATAGASGSISPHGVATVNHGSNYFVVATARTGYLIASFKVDGIEIAAATGQVVYKHTLAGVDAPHTIEATFKLRQHAITATSGQHGSINPVGVVMVDYGQNSSFTVTADAGYVIDTLCIDDELVPLVGERATYTHIYENVSSDGHTISATFKVATKPILVATPVAHNVSSMAGSVAVAVSNIGMGIMPWTAAVNPMSPWITITSGESGSNAGNVVFNYTANTGAARRGGITITAPGAEDSPFAVVVEQAAVAYPVSAIAGANGTISPSGVVSVTHGESVEFTVRAHSGYIIDALIVDGVAVGAAVGIPSYQYTFAGVTAAHSISATFRVAITPILAVTPASISLPSAQGTFSLNVSNIGVNEMGWSVNMATLAPWLTVQSGGSGVDTGAIICTYPLNTTATRVGYLEVEAPGAMGSPLRVYVRQEGPAHIIASACGVYGRIHPLGDITVPYNGSQAFTIKSDDGFVIDTLLIDGSIVTEATGMESYFHLFSDVTMGHTIGVTFTRLAHNVYIVAGAHGTISPAGVVAVNHGSSLEVSVQADSAYMIGSLVVDGSSINAAAGKLAHIYLLRRVVAPGRTVSATFTGAMYNITASAGPCGTISPQGITAVPHGTSPTYTATAIAGYVIDALIVNGQAVASATGQVSYAHTITCITAPHTIRATFKVRTHIITSSSGDNGSITPMGATSVVHGGSQAFTANAHTGYVLDSLVVDGNFLTGVAGMSSHRYTFKNVVEPHSIRASFRPATQPILSVSPPTLEVGSAEGIVAFAVDNIGVGSMAWTASVAQGTDWLTITQGAFGTNSGSIGCAFTATPGPERTATIVVAAPSSTEGSMSVAVVQRPLTYTISAATGEHGSIVPAGDSVVVHGSNVAYAIAANYGYTIDSLVVDGGAIEGVAGLDTFVHIFPNVAANHAIRVMFRTKTYAITATAGTGGSITPTAAVSHGADVDYIVTAHTGYLIDTLKVDGVAVDTAVGLSSYTHSFVNVVDNHTIYVKFRVIIYTITAVAGAGGSITPTAAVSHGADADYTATAHAGYLIDTLKVDGEVINAAVGVASYTHVFSNVVANHSISVTFRVKTYIIAAIAGANGTITPSGEVVVSHGESKDFVISAIGVFKIDSLWVDGVEVVGAHKLQTYTYTFSNINGNHSILVTFRDFTGIKPNHANSVRLHPNPVGDRLNVECDEDIESVQVFDVVGRLVHTEQLDATTHTQLNTSNWSSGAYTVRLKTKTGYSSHRVVKQ